MKVLALILVLLFIAAAPYTAFAHGDETRVELNVTQASPGATIDVRGSGFEPVDTTTITLVNAERRVLLGSAAIDEHGDLICSVLLPMDLANGAYEVRVADTHHTASAPLNIVPDSNGNEESNQRGEDEPLLAPMPPAAISTPMSSANAAHSAMPAAVTPVTQAASATPTSPVLLLSSGLVVAVVAVSAVFIARRTR